MIKVTTEEKISSMYGQKYSMQPSASEAPEEHNLKVSGTMEEEQIQSVWNSIGDRATLLLIAVGDCVVNNKSQAEIAKKYDVPKSRIQQLMSGKREHKKDGKQYEQERKCRASEEVSITSKRSRWDKPEAKPEVKLPKEPKEADPEQKSGGGMDSDELPDVHL